MKFKTFRYPPVKLPPSIDLTLYITREELKSRKLFNILHKARLEECDYQPHLDRLILDVIGLDEESDEVVQFYNDVMEKRCKKINDDRESVVKQALKVYNELVGEKKTIGYELIGKINALILKFFLLYCNCMYKNNKFNGPAGRSLSLFCFIFHSRFSPPCACIRLRYTVLIAHL
jgi:hypothetical protein